MPVRLATVALVVFVLGGIAPGCTEDTTSVTSTTSERSSTTSTTASDGPAPVKVTESGPIALQVGQRAVIELGSNATTGYQWAPTAEPDGRVVTVVSDTYVAPGSQLAGAGGTQKIVVEGVAAGTTTLALGYSRPWEKDTPPARTATFDITVT
jgi:inhibitor of cysteine peptidase